MKTKEIFKVYHILLTRIAVVIKKVDVFCSQDSFSKSEDTSREYEVRDTDSVSSSSSSDPSVKIQ